MLSIFQIYDLYNTHKEGLTNFIKYNNEHNIKLIEYFDSKDSTQTTDGQNLQNFNSNLTFTYIFIIFNILFHVFVLILLLQYRKAICGDSKHCTVIITFLILSSLFIPFAAIFFAIWLLLCVIKDKSKL